MTREELEKQKILTPEILAMAPKDATHFHPYNDGSEVGGGSWCAAFFHKNVEGIDFFSYGEDFGWRAHTDFGSCPMRFNRLIPINREEKVDPVVAEVVAQSFDNIDFDSYPLPEWALCENKHKVLVPGTQLATKDGRHTGNAHIIRTHTADWDSEVRVYQCLTDAGNKINMLESELRHQFYIGTFISHVDDVLDKFDRQNLFFKEPK
ncbi:hypothetical protein PMW_11 [Pseudomonas phage phiPMW]|uniref:Uncharacterized protein n=1 Tax=Pseudomonas phage phiPMW TaxID=1815582 RepID=A0A1S5R151_9CAUD|nr:hypothetical protein FDG97_gp011 [Pseudomonas phage phiPMW]ANA49136.1 hypothetical protein PMW_11 [Pseudomonas phage phiPMW]